MHGGPFVAVHAFAFGQVASYGQRIARLPLLREGSVCICLTPSCAGDVTARLSSADLEYRYALLIAIS
jgi:hypothetical protein